MLRIWLLLKGTLPFLCGHVSIVVADRGRVARWRGHAELHDMHVAVSFYVLEVTEDCDLAPGRELRFGTVLAPSRDAGSPVFAGIRLVFGRR